MIASVEVAVALERAATGDLFAVTWAGNCKAYVESPDEQGLPTGVPEEGLMRVFLTAEEAETYRLAVASYNDAEFEVMRLATCRIAFGLAQYSVDWEWGCPIRIALSRVSPGDWPVDLETLWTVFAVLH